MKSWLAALGVALPLSVFSLDMQPWFGDVYEFRLDTAFTYSQFSKVQGASVQPTGVSNNYLTLLGFGFTPDEDWDVDIEAECARTPRQNYSFRSSAIQGRYRFLDDIAGDPISLTVGLSIRGVGGKSVKDISSPYSSYLNFELNSAIGKEHSFEETWTIRGFAFAAVGMANHGMPWTRMRGSFEGNYKDKHRGELFTEGYFGFGRKDHVNTRDFHGWGHFDHQSIDVGAGYRYVFDYWGMLSLSYACRVFAHSYPQREQFISLRYDLPFSLF